MANCCPNCGCRDIVLAERGYSAAKGLIGFVTFGLVGGLAGFHNSKKLRWVCPQCNARFNQPAQAADPASFTAAPVAPAMPAKQQQAKKPLARSASQPPVVKSRLVCKCGAYNSLYDKNCFSCGAALSLANNKQVAQLPAFTIVCQCGLKNALTHKHCVACGAWLDYSQLEQQQGQISYSCQPCPACGKDTPARSRKVKHCAHCGCEL